jgi:hypothetical protein
MARLPELLKTPKLRKAEGCQAEPLTVARGWGNIARKAAGTAGFWLVLGLITYLGMNAVIKIEATATRLFLVVVVFGVAFGAASLLGHLLWVVPIDIQPNGGPTESWPPWLLTWQVPIVLRDRDSYNYIVLPQPDSSSSESKATIRTGSR